jgi:hypothetical protein
LLKWLLWITLSEALLLDRWAVVQVVEASAVVEIVLPTMVDVEVVAKATIAIEYVTSLQSKLC